LNATRATTIAAAVLLAVLIAFLFGRCTSGRDHDHGATSLGSADAAPTVWTCSMHPNVRQPTQGKCPLCGMDLIPATSGDDDDIPADRAMLRLSPAAIALMGVETWPAGRAHLPLETRLYGSIVPDQTRLASIAAYVPARVERVFVDYCCVDISRGQPLVEVFSPQLIAAQEELIQARRAAQQSGADSPFAANLEAARQRLELLGLLPEQIEEIENQGRASDRVVLRSPMAGTVVERRVVAGDYIEVGTPLFDLADLTRVWAEFEAFERDLPSAREGAEVEFTATAFPGRVFRGEITLFERVLTPGARTVRMRAEIDNQDGSLLLGMFINGIARFTRPGDPAPVVIPASAPLLTGRRAIVYVQVPGAERPTFEPREVTLGRRSGQAYAVESGLEEGELVVTRGAFRIDSELQIRGRPSMMAPSGGPPPAHGAHGTHAAQPARPKLESPPPPEAGELVAALAEPYLLFADALASDDPAGAQAAAVALRDQLRDLEGAGLSGPALEAWRSLRTALFPSVRAAAASSDLASQRRSVGPITDRLEEAIALFGTGSAGALLRAYCPMTAPDQGDHWLQREPAIRNPYWGAMMLNCGEIVGPAGSGAHP
jgi:membrane fusion protein, copper/silver efflux system